MQRIHTPFLTLLFTLIMSIFSSHTAYAATAVASVSENQVTKDEVFLLRVSTDEKVSSDALDLTALESDFYIGRPNFGSSIRIINGSRTVSSEWTITLAPLRLGKLTIPAFDIEGAQTQPIQINVAQNKAAPTQDQMAEFKLDLNRDSLYVGEVAILDVKLIIKADPRRLQDPRIDPPSSSSLKVEPIGESKQYQDVYHGKEVTVVQQSFEVSSDTPGTFELRGPKLTGAVVYSANNSNKTRLFQLDTPVQTLPVEVLSIPGDAQGDWLPTADLSVNQVWSINDTRLTRSPEQLDLEAGDALTRTITVSAKGIKAHQLPSVNVQYPSSVRVYEEKPQFGKTDAGDNLVVYKQVLIPKSAGTIELPGLEQAWFNTETKQKATSQIKGLTLNVTGNSDAPVQAPISTDKPNNVEVVTTYQPGIWPYLTALFAFLWLITSVFALSLWRKKGSTSTVTPKVVGKDETQAELIDAIQRKDALMASAKLSQWQQENLDLPQQHIDTVKQEIDTLNQHLFGPQTDGGSGWSPNSAIDAINAANRNRTIKTSDQLAAL
ncbi:BatD family protein [Vibrio sp. D420a]|uniref:BatD family protein n=1 Tax=Vibrio sp. D420a TaxID=2836895 RepID=UPI002557AF2B|nr:BatD family protein [Vibrio sp. D420a]MDK9764569.1 BatD family protein [Vibrio sp. D420a]